LRIQAIVDILIELEAAAQKKDIDLCKNFFDQLKSTLDLYAKSWSTFNQL
jgi:hypothetical protein